jgi:hypothetical protein
MKMWMIPCIILCKNHLLGEHNEIHKHRHIFVKKYKIDKRITPIIQIEPLQMENRHNELAKEMKNRNYNHNSKYTIPDLNYLKTEFLNAKVDKIYSLCELLLRCNKCRNRFINIINQI